MTNEQAINWLKQIADQYVYFGNDVYDELRIEAIGLAIKALENEGHQKGEWIDYDNTFYKCPDCGYLLEKCCPHCQTKVILPKGGAE